MDIRRIDGTLIGTCDVPTISLALQIAMKNGTDLHCADLSGANLSRVKLPIRSNLSGADLSDADLSGAQLCFANFSGAKLAGTCLCKANLSGANFRKACLAGACLYGADLSMAYCFEANFSRSYLSGAHLYKMDLSGADLSDARYDVPQMLKADWGDVEPEICAHLMRLNASAVPNGFSMMDNWAAGGVSLPARIAVFQERREHWGLVKSLPQISLWELWERLAASKEVKI